MLLSATYGPVPFDIDLFNSERYENPTIESASQAKTAVYNGPTLQGSTILEQADGHDDPLRLVFENSGNPLSLRSTSHPMGPRHDVIVITVIYYRIGTQENNAASDFPSPIALTNPGQSSLTHLNSGRGFVNGSTNSLQNQLSFQFPSDNAVWFLNPSSAQHAFQDFTPNQSSVADELRDAAFDEYSSEGLQSVDGSSLLSSSNENTDNISSAAFFDEVGFDSQEQTLCDGVLSPLNPLEQELHAVDTVLSHLRNFAHQKEESNWSILDNRAKPDATTFYNTGDESSVTEASQQGVIPPHVNTAGGMVLLVPAADVSMGDDDLDGVLLDQIERVFPREVEVSVGIYQAFDVGINQAADSPGENSTSAKPAFSASCSGQKPEAAADTSNKESS